MGDLKRLAWHFLKEDCKTQFPPRLKVSVGKILSIDSDKLVICQFGLHASVKLRDALQYASGPVLCRVEVSGKILEQPDKLCCEHREVLAMADITETLQEMALWSAEQVLGNIKDSKNRAIALKAIQTKRKFLLGLVTKEELEAAESAAWSAAWSAARSAARSAAESAWSAAESAARSAAWSAAWSAAETAARSAAWSAASTAARSAASTAARSAAESAQNEHFEFLVRQLPAFKGVP